MRIVLPLGLLTLVSVFLVACASPTQAPPPGRTGAEAGQSQSQPSGQGSARDAANQPNGVDTTNGGASVLRIQPGASTASFAVDEILRGSPNTVIGTTDQVSGEIELDADDPSATKLGTITVDARTLATDSGQRDNMIHRFILATSQFESISFTPTGISGLPTALTPGMAYPVRIDGKLTIKDTTRDVSFNATVTPMSANELRGSATTTISQREFGITIPQVPFVASVADEVRLDLNFVAAA